VGAARVARGLEIEEREEDDFAVFAFLSFSSGDEFMEKQGDGRASERRDARRRALREISFVIVCVLIAEWAILPIFGRDLRIGLIPVLTAFIYMFISHRRHGETARALGWRTDNFVGALKLLLPAMLLAAASLLLASRAAGWVYAGRYRVGWPLLLTFWWLFLWGLMQQYALQAFINRRAQVVWGRGRASVLAVALVFGLLHLPNFWLTLATFTAGLYWAYVYQRAPNLPALALSHSVMTMVLISTVPSSALHGLRVGYNYFR
jgi:membrane protease YdiL (CAAX protease family)